LQSTAKFRIGELDIQLNLRLKFALSTGKIFASPALSEIGSAIRTTASLYNCTNDRMLIVISARNASQSLSREWVLKGAGQAFGVLVMSGWQIFIIALTTP
jgi:hypothetical protein